MSILDLSTDFLANCECCGRRLLSPKEREVFLLYGSGFGSQEIADELNVKSNAIQTHRRNIIFKLGLEDSRELVYLATRLLFERELLEVGVVVPMSHKNKFWHKECHQ